MIQNVDEPNYSVFVLNRNIMLNPYTTINDSKFIFALTDGQHFLHQIAVADDNHIHDIIHGADVVELAGMR